MLLLLELLLFHLLLLCYHSLLLHHQLLLQPLLGLLGGVLRCELGLLFASLLLLLL